MHYLAPLVIILGLSGALYKTQEVFPMETYKIRTMPVYGGTAPPGGYSTGGRQEFPPPTAADYTQEGPGKAMGGSQLR